MPVRLITKKSSTFHDFPYSGPKRKCFHCWIVNATPPGPNQCLHDCIYCYAREAIYSNYSEDTLIYSNLPELVEKDLKKLTLCPPISLSNVSDPCQSIPELLSPKAPPFEARIATVSKLSRLGIDATIRLNPIFIHLFQALYGDYWFSRIAVLIDVFASTGAKGMTYATCQELSAEESDSSGIPSCEGLPLPFAEKQADGKFKTVPGCTANCHVSCQGLTIPPCGHPELVTFKPFTLSKLCFNTMLQKLVDRKLKSG